MRVQSSPHRQDGSAIPSYGATFPTIGLTGNIEAIAQYAGQSVERVTEVLPAREIIEVTMRQAREPLAGREAFCLPNDDS